MKKCYLKLALHRRCRHEY